MVDTSFENKVDRTLSSLYENIDDNFPDIDTEYSNDIVTLDYQGKTFVINKHSASSMIWCSSPISGPSYFSYREDSDSFCNKDGVELSDFVTREMQSI